MNFFKRGWKLSGQLDKKMYITIPNVFWTLFLIFFIVSSIAMTFQDFKSTPDKSGLGVTGAFTVLVMLVIFVFAWYINARLNPFVLRSLNINVRKAINSGTKEYKNIKNNGPQYVTKKDNPFAGDYIRHELSHRVVGNTEYTDVLYESNYHDVLENKYELLFRAFKEGFGKGMGMLVDQFIFHPLLRIMLWPLSFILAWFGMKPYLVNNHQDNSNVVADTQKATVSGSSTAYSTGMTQMSSRSATQAVRSQKMTTPITNSTGNTTTSQSTTDKTNFCANCGAKIDVGAKFCTHCGTKIN